jgi:hypothetical protein
MSGYGNTLPIREAWTLLENFPYNSVRKQQGMRKRFLYGFLMAVLLLVSVVFVRSGLQLLHKLQAKKTITRMTMLMGVLETEKPAVTSISSLRPLAARYNRSECLEDAWGRPFVIERNERAQPGEPSYTIISLGSDGARSGCCEGRVADLTLDAVLRGKEWLQVWYLSNIQ